MILATVPLLAPTSCHIQTFTKKYWVTCTAESSAPKVEFVFGIDWGKGYETTASNWTNNVTAHEAIVKTNSKHIASIRFDIGRYKPQAGHSSFEVITYAENAARTGASSHTYTHLVQGAKDTEI